MHRPDLSGRRVVGRYIEEAKQVAYETASRRGQLRTVAVAIGLLSAIAIAVALFSIGSALDTQSCVAKATGRYPTVPVSAFVGASRSATGPLKVSFAAERAKAVESC
jgi:hypothetical protein